MVSGEQALSTQHKLCTRKTELALEVKFISTFIELHVYGNER